jgi:hypothetical protein
MGEGNDCSVGGNPTPKPGIRHSSAFAPYKCRGSSVAEKSSTLWLRVDSRSGILASSERRALPYSWNQCR